jgi:DNA-binding response OmpR family regulator
VSTINLYVIDDDRDMLFSIKYFLNKNGFLVSNFFKWDTALEAMKKSKPQIILLDLFLNSKDGVDGFDVCQKLKASPFTKKIPILLFSGFPKIGKNAIADYGTVDFIEKPFKFKELLSKLYSILPNTENDTVK